MKKLFAIVLIAAIFVACNEGETKVETATPNADSASAIIDSAISADKNDIDSIAKLADSTINAAYDSTQNN